AYDESIGMIAKGSLNGHGFQLVIKRRGSSMSVDVADLLRAKVRICEGIHHYAMSAVTVLRRLSDVKRVSRHPVSHDLSVDRGSLALGHFQFFKQQDSRALANYKAISILVKGARGSLRFLVPSRKRLH